MLPVESSQPHHLLPISVFSSTSNHSTHYQTLAWQDQAQVLGLPHRAQGSNEFTTSGMAKEGHGFNPWLALSLQFHLIRQMPCLPWHYPDPFPAWHSSITWSVIWHCSPYWLWQTPTRSVNSPRYTWSSMKAELYFLQFYDVPGTKQALEHLLKEWMKCQLHSPSYSCSTRENFLQEVEFYQHIKQRVNSEASATILMRTSSPVLDSLPSEDSYCWKSVFYIPNPTPKLQM